jgi:hypothetical protein
MRVALHGMIEGGVRQREDRQGPSEEEPGSCASAAFGAMTTVPRSILADRISKVFLSIPFLL